MNKHLIYATLALALSAPAIRADIIYNVTLNTSVLAGNSGQGSFAVDFQLNDGSAGDGVGNNKATISNFNLNGGSLTAGTASSTGIVSGSLSSTLTITDGVFFNDFNQAFTPGSSLSFTVDLTTNVSSSEAGSPDQFSFAVYSNSFGSLASLLTIDITGPTLSPVTAGGALGNGTPVPAPNVAAVPEPSTLTLFAFGLLGLAAGAWRRHRQAA